MTYSVFRDLLASFSHSSEFLALSPGDGRIKIWNTVKGQLQTEFTDFSSTSENSLIPSESKMGHLAMDYKCMKWVQLESKKKKKPSQSLLVLGTGGGDVLALEASTGQLRWRICDCHPGGVSAISFCGNNLFLYTAGVDGMVSQIDCLLGSVVRKFRSSTKGISSLSVSADGTMLATAAGQLKIFDCSDFKKMQKFMGHPVSVRCMIFSEDGNFVVSSGVGEKHIAIWKVDGGKRKSASCVLSMEHPAVFLDCRCSITEGSKARVLYVLALSEKGTCSLWCGSSVELHNAKPTKITLSVEPSQSKALKNQAIFAAKFEKFIRSGCALVHVAHGSLIKPSFEKLSVENGVDIILGVSLDGALLPVRLTQISKQGKEVHGTAITTLDHANAEDAIFPVPRLHGHEKKRKHGTPSPAVEFSELEVGLVKSKNKTFSTSTEAQEIVVDETICIEDKLREAGLLDCEAKVEKNVSNGLLNDAAMHDSLNFTVAINLPKKKIRSQISSMSSVDASKILALLVLSWKARSACSSHLLQWIYYILVFHGWFIISQESSLATLDSLEKMVKYKSAAIHPLLKLSGRLQLIISQIDKSGAHWNEKFGDKDEVEEDEEDNEEDVDEVLYGVDEGSDSDD